MWQFKATTTGILLLLLAATLTVAQRVAPGVPPQHYQAPNQHQQQQMHPQHQQQQQYQQQQQQIHVAPGVAPQQYQQYQQPPVPQQQQPPQQYQQQQQQQQYQQAPPPQPQVQQHQQVPTHQQQQGHHGQHAPHAHHGQQVLHTGNIQDERAHIQEHMQVPIDTSKMSEAELQFHYFKMHDSDNNNKLDGCELIKSLIHWHVEDDKAKPGDSTTAQPAAGADATKPKQGGTGEKNGTVYTDEGLAEIIDYVLKTMDMNKDGYVDYPEYLTTNDNVGKD